MKGESVTGETEAKRRDRSNMIKHAHFHKFI